MFWGFYYNHRHVLGHVCGLSWSTPCDWRFTSLYNPCDWTAHNRHSKDTDCNYLTSIISVKTMLLCHFRLYWGACLLVLPNLSLLRHPVSPLKPCGSDTSEFSGVRNYLQNQKSWVWLFLVADYLFTNVIFISQAKVFCFYHFVQIGKIVRQNLLCPNQATQAKSGLLEF